MNFDRTKCVQFTLERFFIPNSHEKTQPKCTIKYGAAERKLRETKNHAHGATGRSAHSEHVLSSVRTSQSICLSCTNLCKHKHIPNTLKLNPLPERTLFLLGCCSVALSFVIGMVRCRQPPAPAQTVALSTQTSAMCATHSDPFIHRRCGRRIVPSTDAHVNSHNTQKSFALDSRRARKTS